MPRDNTFGQTLVQSRTILENVVVNQVTVGTAAVELKSGSTPLTNRKLLTISASSAIYIGFNNNVTTANGFEIPANVPFTLDFDPVVAVSVYAIAAANTQVSIMEA